MFVKLVQYFDTSTQTYAPMYISSSFFIHYKDSHEGIVYGEAHLTFMKEHEVGFRVYREAGPKRRLFPANLRICMLN